MKKRPLITIIVPVYQVKEYINECVDSLLTQTYANLEILLVDDGSTDGSGAACDAYAAEDARVRAIHQENQGLSEARNTGLDYAQGEYVAFVDSDDVVLADFIETLYELIEKYQADISSCTFLKCRTEELERIRITGINVQTISSRNRLEICMSSEQMLRQWHGKYKKWETVVWNKLYRRSVLEGDGGVAIHFSSNRRHEDVLVSHLIVHNAEKVALTNRKLYLYRIRESSITADIMTVENQKQNLSAQRERMAFFRKKRYWRAYLNLLAGYVLHLWWFGWRRIRKGRKA